MFESSIVNRLSLRLSVYLHTYPSESKKLRDKEPYSACMYSKCRYPGRQSRKRKTDKTKKTKSTQSKYRYTRGETLQKVTIQHDKKSRETAVKVSRGSWGCATAVIAFGTA